MFAKRKNRGNLRKKRETDEASGAGDDGTEVVRKAKVARGGLDLSTKKAGGEDAGPSSGAAAHQVAYTSDKTIQSKGDGGATRTIEVDTAQDRDGRALREQRLEAEKKRLEAAGGEGEAACPPADGEKTYAGANAYTDWRSGFRREQTTAGDKATGRHGPLRAAGNVRATAIFDYQPCICKDYKETGFCSYGDACKFLHDRSDYKSGWELEREWEEEQKAKMAKRMAKMEAGKNPDDSDFDESSADEEDEDDLPFACHVCRKDWAECSSDPVKLRCDHYLCEGCALSRQAKGRKRCALCDQQTQGIFNHAPEIVRKFLSKRKEGKEGEEEDASKEEAQGDKPRWTGQWSSADA